MVRRATNQRSGELTGCTTGRPCLDDLVRQHGNGALRRCSTGFRASHRETLSGGSRTKPGPAGMSWHASPRCPGAITNDSAPFQCPPCWPDLGECGFSRAYSSFVRSPRTVAGATASARTSRMMRRSGPGARCGFGDRGGEWAGCVGGLAPRPSPRISLRLASAPRSLPTERVRSVPLQSASRSRQPDPDEMTAGHHSCPYPFQPGPPPC